MVVCGVPKEKLRGAGCMPAKGQSFCTLLISSCRRKVLTTEAVSKGSMCPVRRDRLPNTEAPHMLCVSVRLGNAYLGEMHPPEKTREMPTVLYLCCRELCGLWPKREGLFLPQIWGFECCSKLHHMMGHGTYLTATPIHARASFSQEDVISLAQPRKPWFTSGDPLLGCC